MRIVSAILLAVALSGCAGSSGTQGQMPDPAAYGGGMGGPAPGGSPYEQSSR